MSIINIENKGAVLCSYKCDGGGNQSGKKIAEMLNYKFYDLNTEEWKTCKEKKQIWYMNDDIYKLNGKDREEFEAVLKYADDIKIVLNFVIGGTDKQKWLIRYPVKKVIFFNKGRVDEWKKKVQNSPQKLIEVDNILPPINLELFDGTKRDKDKIQIGRHSRIYGKYPDNPTEMYEKLDNDERDFHFMLAHPKIAKEFKDNESFHFYKWSELPVHEFLAKMDIYLAIINPKTKEQAGRSNMEAMAAGCCVITEDRDGPVDYIKHGETGFLVKSQEEAMALVRTLSKKEIRRIGNNARKYALENFEAKKWVDII